jgi:hypothetical protein
LRARFGLPLQVFNDPVHGHIFLSGLACDIIGACCVRTLPVRTHARCVSRALVSGLQRDAASLHGFRLPLQTRPSSSGCAT